MHLAPLRAHRHCALIIDDERDAAEALQVLLTMHGYDQARVAESGTEALATLRTDFHPCVIVLDMHMPTMNGLAFLQAKGVDRALAAIPVIAVSGSGEENPVLAGAAAFMLKPIDLGQLLALMSEHCAHGLDGDKR